MEKEIDCQGTDNIVCPYCGHEMEHEEGNPAGKQQCYECEKFFECEPSYSVTFYTSKVDCWNGAPHDMRKCPGWPINPGEKVPWNCRDCGFTEWREPTPSTEGGGDD